MMLPNILATIICVFFGLYINSSFCEGEKHAESIPITEDIMKEHGILNRILLIYEEVINRATKHQSFDMQDLVSALSITRLFIEDYHEKIEEEYIFPLFKEHAKKELIDVLIKQHHQGRSITTLLQNLASQNTLSRKEKNKIKHLLQKFVYMYGAHESREDTIIFPLVRSLLTKEKFSELSILSDKLEDKLFGEDGFDLMLKKVIKIEKNLGIHNLKHYS